MNQGIQDSSHRAHFCRSRASCHFRGVLRPAVHDIVSEAFKMNALLPGSMHTMTQRNPLHHVEQKSYRGPNYARARVFRVHIYIKVP